MQPPNQDSTAPNNDINEQPAKQPTIAEIEQEIASAAERIVKPDEPAKTTDTQEQPTAQVNEQFDNGGSISNPIVLSISSTPIVSAQPFAGSDETANTQNSVSAMQQPTQDINSVVTSRGIIAGGVDDPNDKKSINLDDKPYKISKKSLIIGGFASFVLIISAAAFVFLWFLPNRPNAVWNTGLARTGSELDAIVKTLQSDNASQKLSKNAIELKGTMQWDSLKLAIDASSKYDSINSDSVAGIKSEDTKTNQKYDINLALKAQSVADAALPNIYFKLSGVKSLAQSSGLPVADSVLKYDDKWVAIEQDFWKKISDTANDNSPKTNITQKDIMAVVGDFQTVAKDYVFTNDPKKDVIQQSNFVGTEKSEGITANHYKAAINAENARAFCNAVVDKLAQNNTLKTATGQSDKQIQDLVKEQKESCARTKISDKQFDIWIDKKTKTIHKVRLYEDLETRNAEMVKKKAECLGMMRGFSDTSNCNFYDSMIETGERYTEFGQVLKKRDQIMIFVNGVSKTNRETSDMRAEININTTSLAINGSLKSHSGENNKNTVDITMQTKPYDGTVDAAKPANTVPLQQVLDAMGLGNSL